MSSSASSFFSCVKIKRTLPWGNTSDLLPHSEMMVGTGGTSVDGVRPLELPGPAIPAENYGAWGCILIRWGNLGM